MLAAELIAGGGVLGRQVRLNRRNNTAREGGGVLRGGLERGAVRQGVCVVLGHQVATDIADIGNIERRSGKQLALYAERIAIHYRHLPALIRADDVG